MTHSFTILYHIKLSIQIFNSLPHLLKIKYQTHISQISHKSKPQIKKKKSTISRGSIIVNKSSMFVCSNSC